MMIFRKKGAFNNQPVSISQEISNDEICKETDNDDLNDKEIRQDFSATDTDDSDTNPLNNDSVATQMEILVAEHIYPGIEWTVDLLLKVSNLISPALNHCHSSSFKKRVISPEILRLYDVSPPKQILCNQNDIQKNSFDDQLVQEASIQILENSRETATGSTYARRKILPLMPQQRQMTNSAEKISARDTNVFSAKNAAKTALTPFQIQKSLQSKNLLQDRSKSEPNIISNIILNAFNHSETNNSSEIDKTPLSNNRTIKCNSKHQL